MLKTIRIIRPLNLAMMAGVMLLARYCLILPAFETEKIITGVEPEHLGRWMFALLTFGTCCIGAAGNVINDRFDVLTDSVNRPGTNIVGEKITIKQAETIFIVLSIIGSFIGVFMGLSSDKPFLAVIHPFTALSLWMYSSFYKRRMLSGNFMIACLTFLIILLPGLFEPEFYRNIQYLLLYALIGFLVTLAREIVKDAEDVDGDERMQYKTLPVRYGTGASKITSTTVLTITVIFLCYLCIVFFKDSSVTSWWNIAAGLTLPLVGCCYFIITAQDSKDFHFISVFLKGYLALGMLTMLPFWYFFLR